MKTISSNLASKPFLNRRVPLLICAVLAALALLATVTNLALFVIRGKEYRELKAEGKAQQTRVKELEEALRADQVRLEGKEAAQYWEEARFAETLFVRKRFSWTMLLNRLESVKPFGVSFSEISPRMDDAGAVELRLRGSATQREEMLKLEQNLLGDAHFMDPKLTDEKPAQGGSPLTEFQITVTYLAAAGGSR